MAKPPPSAGSGTGPPVEWIVFEDRTSDKSIDDVVFMPETQPPDMDAASWALVMKLRADQEHPEKKIGTSILPPPSRRRWWKRRREREERVHLLEFQDRSIDGNLLNHVEEGVGRREECCNTMQQEQEILDFAIAQSLHHVEEEHCRLASRQSLSKEEVLSSLKPFQRKAVDYVTAKAKEMHDQSLPSLRQRAISLGFTAENIQQCLEYIRDDAPIVIHVSKRNLKRLLKDSHYRNLFETHTSGGARDKKARKKWEGDMFDNSYDTNECKPFDRPKYGCLNVCGDIAGVKSARGYGDNVLILNQHVRHRATFFNRDTGAFWKSQTLATNEYYAHILSGYNDTDLTTALEVCTIARVRGAQSNCSTYKEVQIHGPVCLATDVQALSISGSERNANKRFKKRITKFQKKVNCNILWQEDLQNPEFTLNA